MARLKVEENYPLASLTTFNVGGPAKYYVSVKSEAALIKALEFAKSLAIPIFILGGGSNILVSDNGFDGLVIRNGIKGITSRPQGDYHCIYARSGEDWQYFVDWCVSEKLQGIECLAGIPGTVGAAPVQNIGAYGQEVSDTIGEVRAIEVSTGKSIIFRNEECGFGYRTSIFSSTSAGKYFISSVAFMLKRNGKSNIVHDDLKNQLKETSNLTLKQVRDATIAIRAGKGLVMRKGYERFRCASSFFKNPIVSEERARDIEGAVRKLGGDIHCFWPLRSGEVKISAASLIQSAGFWRGYRKGNVGLSPKHALVIIAYGTATAREIIEFAEEIQGKVKEKFGVLLRREIGLVGFP